MIWTKGLTKDESDKLKKANKAGQDALKKAVASRRKEEAENLRKSKLRF